jgi:hypothetical protein
MDLPEGRAPQLKLQLNSPQKVGIEHAEAELVKPFQDT